VSLIEQILADQLERKKTIHGSECMFCGSNESALYWNSKYNVLECRDESACVARCKETPRYKAWEHFVPIRPEVYV
jgi:hypothetical protein